MKPILTILHDPARAEVYAHMARSAGVGTRQTDAALHALTQLERTEVSAIICEADMGDMTGEELSSVVHTEEKNSTLPVFILPDPQALVGQSDLSLPAPSGPEIMSQALQISGVARTKLPLPMNRELPAQLQGNLEQFPLSELLGWVAEMRFDGHWLVTVEDEKQNKRQAHLVMSVGDLIYGEYNGLVGKAAILALLKASMTFANTTFSFYRSGDIPAVRSGCLNQTTARLLIELAVDIDHSSARTYPPGAH